MFNSWYLYIFGIALDNGIKLTIYCSKIPKRFQIQSKELFYALLGEQEIMYKSNLFFDK